MKKRLILLAGLGVGFVLGSRTGRQSYERLKTQAQELWSDPRVQDTVVKANQTIREKSPAVADAVQTATDKVNAAADSGAPAATGSEAPASAAEGDEPNVAGTTSGPDASSPKAQDAVADPARRLEDEGPGAAAED